MRSNHEKSKATQEGVEALIESGPTAVMSPVAIGLSLITSRESLFAFLHLSLEFILIIINFTGLF